MKVNYYIGKILIFLFKNSFLEGVFVYFITRYFVKKYKKGPRADRPRLFWGTTPIINNKYFSNALKELGFKSDVVVSEYYSINNKEDFDFYYEDILNQYNLPKFIRELFSNWILIDYALKNYDIFHIPYHGNFLGNTKYWNKEAYIFQSCNKKIIMIPYGGDSFMYSKIKSSSQQHALLINYPQAAKNESDIERKFKYWQSKADCCMGGGMIDGFGRWDTLAVNFLSIDTTIWRPKIRYNLKDGVEGAVTIIHTPNHRGVKGTEFILKAIDELKSEGILINLILIENRKNDEVKKILLEEADILIEQLIMIGHGLSAIEGMATGVPVLSNLDDKNFSDLFNRYSFLNECPILSTTPENIKQNLKILIKNPALRKTLGIASRKYVEKYHSNITSQYLFEKVYDKIWFNKNVDLINMFHPLLPNSYNNQSPRIEHPLFENKISEALLNTLNK